MNKTQVLQDYRNGDAEKRLSFFLYYRDLRNEFSCIDGEQELERSLGPWAPMCLHGTIARSHGHFPGVCNG
jgi:hypothetical protein